MKFFEKIVVPVSLIAILLVVISGLFSMFGLASVFPFRESLDNHNRFTQEYKVQEFSKIDISTSGKVNLVQSEITSVEIETTERTFSLLDVKVSGDTLKIHHKNPIFFSWHNQKSININISSPNIQDIHTSGSVDITSSDIQTDSLEINTSGSSQISIDNLQPKEFSSKISGSGEIDITGNADELDLRISGSGQFIGREFEVSESNLKITGSGNATVNASDQLNVNISGSGDVRYIGNPAINQDISGSGSIKQL